MKKVAAAIFLLFLPLTVHAWTAEVVSVIDGDSILVDRAGHGKVEVRLYGIDAPESHQPSGRAARKNLAPVAIVRNPGICLNEKMVGAGYAWVYRNFCRKSFCRDWLELEEEAKRSGKGLWHNPAPVPPWEWRRKK
jgi:endonuclease YncB( thermonuclease family)